MASIITDSCLRSAEKAKSEKKEGGSVWKSYWCEEEKDARLTGLPKACSPCLKSSVLIIRCWAIQEKGSSSSCVYD